MSSKIRTTGQLRSFLLDAIERLDRGELAPDKAAQMAKLAGQVNTSMMVEVRVAIVNAEAGKPRADFGDLDVAGVNAS
jgi:hypothetical protein